MNRRHFLLQTLAAVPAARSAYAQSFNLEEVTLGDLEQGFRSGRFMSRSVTEWYLARIETLDKNGPRVNSVIELNPDALAIADALDRERSSKGPRGAAARRAGADQRQYRNRGPYEHHRWIAGAGGIDRGA